MTSVRHHPTAALAAIICLGMPGAVAAQGQAPLEVTLAEAIRRSLDVQPAMVQARGAARNAGAGERSAWGAFLPTVSTSASASRSNTSSFRTGTTDTLPPLYSYSGGLSASLVLFDGFSRFANLRSSAATQDAAVAGLVNQRYQTTLATQQAFFAALADEELVRVAEAQVQRARQQLQISVNKFQAGAATRSDTLTSTVDLGTAQLNLLQAQASLATAQAALGRQIGVDQRVRALPDTTFPPLPDTTALRPAAPQVWSARSQYWPSLIVSYSNSRTGTGSPSLPLFGTYPENFTWRFGLSWTLFNGFQREQAQVSASVARDNAAAQAADARRQVNAQLTQQLAALSTAYVQIGIAGANVVAATEALRVQQERYRVGAGTQLDEVTAEANLTQAEVNRVQARYNYRIARAQLEAIVGHAL